MTFSHPSRRRPLRLLRAGALILAVAAAAAAGAGHGLPGSSASTPIPRTDAAAPPDVPPGPLGVSEGAVPDGTTVFADDVPGVTRLDPDLLGALRRAATDAGQQFAVDSGWRSAAYQQHLLDDAVRRYGSARAAARWVAPPDRSAHVSGDAVDLGPAASRTWLGAHGARYGLCRPYANEPWHVELRPEAVAHGCPPPYADPTADPRLQR